jgi:hypothetical protein
MSNYPKIKTAIPLDDWRLQVAFVNGVCKVYDCKPLLRNPAFAPLSLGWLFRAVQVDAGGYGVSWNDEIDLSESELWEHGTRFEPALVTATPA